MSNLVDIEIPIPGHVTRTDILCVVLPLYLACVTHPLGSSGSLPLRRWYFTRLSPSTSLYDSVHLVLEVIDLVRRHDFRIQDAIGRVFLNRIPEVDKSKPDSDRGLYTKLQRTFTDIRVRLIISIFCIVQYTKLCGYRGIPITFSICTMIFATWFIMETLFFAAYFLRSCRTPGPRPPSPLRHSTFAQSCILVFELLLIITVVTVDLFRKLGDTTEYCRRDESDEIICERWSKQYPLLVSGSYKTFTVTLPGFLG